jgi:MoxR-like ATPase
MTALGHERAPAVGEEMAQLLRGVAANVGSVLFGKRDVVRLALVCLAAGGHLLIEDLPGVGKTTLAKALAHSFDLEFRRVQFTADLLPSDVTGALIYDRDLGAPVFRPGPVFTNILLADELNRASPKAQSALLEAMEETQVSSDGVSHQLPRPFMVMATQNPFDSAGTFPLPFSQRDRFLMCISVGYPARQAEDRLLATSEERPRVEDLPPIGNSATLAELGQAVKDVHVAAEVRGYVLDIVEATRQHPNLAVGASPRGALSLLRASCAYAVTAGRTYCTPDDVKAVAEPVLAHRLAPTPAAEMAGISMGSVVSELLAMVPVAVRAPATT